MTRERRLPLSLDEFELELDELFELHGSDDVLVLVFVEVLALVLPAKAGVAATSIAVAANMAIRCFICFSQATQPART